MSFKFLSGMSKQERTRALEQVVSGETRLYANIADKTVVIPKNIERELQEKAIWNNQLITGDDIELPLAVTNGNFKGGIDGYLQQKYLAGSQGLTKYMTHEPQMLEVSNGSSAALQMISEHDEANGEVINEEGEDCFVLNCFIQKLRHDRGSCLGYSHTVFEEKHLAVAALPRSQPDKNHKDSLGVSKKTVRRDEVTSNIHEYLEGCAKTSTQPNIDNCWRFLAKKHDLHGDGYLIWYTQGGEPRHVTKKQVSSRLTNALRDYSPN